MWCEEEQNSEFKSVQSRWKEFLKEFFSKPSVKTALEKDDFDSVFLLFFRYCKLKHTNPLIITGKFYNFLIHPCNIEVWKYLTYVPSYIFNRSEFTNLKIVLPDTIYQIQEEAFCFSNIKQFVGGNNLEIIEEEAFKGCSELTTVDLRNTKVKSLPNFCFNNCINLSILAVPKNCKIDEKELSNHSSGGNLIIKYE